MVAKEDLHANDFLLRFKAADSRPDNRQGNRRLEIVATYGILLTCISFRAFILLLFAVGGGSRVCVCVCVCVCMCV